MAPAAGLKQARTACYGAGMTDGRETALELVLGDAPSRLQRRLRLMPADGLGVGRRALLFALVAWLPIAVWAVVRGRALQGALAEPLFQHFGVNVRCLVAIPLMVIAEATSHGAASRLVRRLEVFGMVPAATRSDLDAAIRSLARLRDAWLPWVFVVGLVVGLLWLTPDAEHNHELVWAESDAPGSLEMGFGGWWYVLVARPLFVALAVAWLWRIAFWAIALGRIVRLDLAPVPTHPDGMFGLGLLQRTPIAFAPFVLGISCVVASVWAHQVLYHGVRVETLAAPAAAFVALMTLLQLAPLLGVMPVLSKWRRQALEDYGALLSRHGRLVHQRWIEGRELEDTRVLEAPELGPVADTISLYEAAKQAQALPVTRQTLVLVLAPIVLPLLAVVALQIPLREILKVLLKAVA